MPLRSSVCTALRSVSAVGVLCENNLHCCITWCHGDAWLLAIICTKRLVEHFAGHQSKHRSAASESAPSTSVAALGLTSISTAQVSVTACAPQLGCITAVTPIASQPAFGSQPLPASLAGGSKSAAKAAAAAERLAKREAKEAEKAAKLEDKERKKAEKEAAKAERAAAKAESQQAKAAESRAKGSKACEEITIVLDTNLANLKTGRKLLDAADEEKKFKTSIEAGRLADRKTILWKRTVPQALVCSPCHTCAYKWIIGHNRSQLLYNVHSCMKQQYGVVTR